MSKTSFDNFVKDAVIGTIGLIFFGGLFGYFWGTLASQVAMLVFTGVFGLLLITMSYRRDKKRINEAVKTAEERRK